ncbi:hypothetical protein KEJ17_00340 [Candidatus Bathyarchaeota archaeon]|nr:hypothetical protein [Candidatus Bathyarchaeota archaeon]
MGEEEKRRNIREDTDWIGLFSLGFFLITIGTLWMITPNLTEEVINFFKDFQLVHLTEHIILPAPAHSHPVVYTAALQFCLVFGLFQIIILILRFIFGSSLNKKAETLSGAGFWLTMSLFLQMLINENIGWFGLIGGLVTSIGIAITLSSLLKLLG